MRQKRAKTYKKLMSLYSMHFGFREPYQVLVDSEMCSTVVDSKLDLVKQLSVVLHGQVKPMITQCCIHELYLQGKSRQPTVDLAKTFERRRCNHREPIPGDDCLTSVVGDTNKHRYVIAAQSNPLRSLLRSIPAVPIIHINRSVVVLEPPSDVTVETKRQLEQKALLPPTSEFAAPAESLPPKKKRKGPKGPNPLSIKKKQKDITGTKRKREGGEGEDEGEIRRKRKRRRKPADSSIGS